MRRRRIASQDRLSLPRETEGDTVRRVLYLIAVTLVGLEASVSAQVRLFDGGNTYYVNNYSGSTSGSGTISGPNQISK